MSKRAAPDSARPPSPPAQRHASSVLRLTPAVFRVRNAGTPSNRPFKAGGPFSVTPQHGAAHRIKAPLRNKSTSNGSTPVKPMIPAEKFNNHQDPQDPQSQSQPQSSSARSAVPPLPSQKLPSGIEDFRVLPVPDSNNPSSSSRTGDEADALAQLRTEIKSREASLTALRAELAGKIRDDLDRTMAELDRTREELMKARSEVKDLQGEKEKLHEMQKAVAREQAELGKLKEGKAKLDSEVQRLRAEVDARSGELQKSEEDKEKLEKEKQQMRVEHAKMTEEKEELDRLRREKQNVVRELDDLRSKLEGLLGSNLSRDHAVKREDSPPGARMSESPKWSSDEDMASFD